MTQTQLKQLLERHLGEHMPRQPNYRFQHPQKVRLGSESLDDNPQGQRCPITRQTASLKPGSLRTEVFGKHGSLRFQRIEHTVDVVRIVGGRSAMAFPFPFGLVRRLLKFFNFVFDEIDLIG